MSDRWVRKIFVRKVSKSGREQIERSKRRIFVAVIREEGPRSLSEKQDPTQEGPLLQPPNIASQRSVGHGPGVSVTTVISRYQGVYTSSKR